MIVGAQNTRGIPQDPDEAFRDTDINLHHDLAITDSVMEDLITRRNRVLSGGVNCIPLPFTRLRSDIPGIEQEQYVVVSANQKTGKSQIANFIYVYNALDYAFEHPDQCSVHIIYFALEESIKKIITRYMCYLLFKLDGIRISPNELRSTNADYPVPDNVLALLQSDKYMERRRFLEEHVQFETTRTSPEDILDICVEYAKTVGTYTSREVSSPGSFKSKTIIDDYKDKDPKHYKIVIVDHIGLVEKTSKLGTKAAIDQISEYFVQELRNKYRYCCVAIQQQAAEAEGLEAVKQKKMVPTTSTLSDSKYTARDADLVLGLFDPSRFGLASWLGYTIQDPEGNGLRGYARFLYVLANRNDEMGGICPLFFDGAVCNFEELPKVEDVDALNQYYQRVKNIKTYRQKKKLTLLTLFLFIKQIFNHGTNNSDLR